MTFEEELDAWIASRPKREVETDIEKLTREIASHPMFIDHDPTAEDFENSPALQAIQALKFDSDDPFENMTALKEDGNKWFQKKLYKKAITDYTQALEICSNIQNRLKRNYLYLSEELKKLKGVLLANRAAANYRLGNKRKAATDSNRALSIDPTHRKAALRLTQCLLDLNSPKEALAVCKAASETWLDDDSFQDLCKKSQLLLKTTERDRRKEERQENALRKRRKTLSPLLIARGIPESIQELIYQDAECGVSLVNEDELVWPVNLFYPLTSQCDFIQQWNETVTFSEQLEIIWSDSHERPFWDTQGEYLFSKGLRVFFESFKGERLKEVALNSSLLSVIKSSAFHTTTVQLDFYVIPSSSSMIDDVLDNVTKYQQRISRNLTERYHSA